MPTPPERSSGSDRNEPSEPSPRIRDRAYIGEVKSLVGQWRHTAEVYGLTRHLNPENPEDAAVLADPRHQGYEQATAAITLTLADAPSLDVLLRRYWFETIPYRPSSTLEPSDSTPSKRKGRRRKHDQEQPSFRDLLLDACTRYSPDDQPLNDHVILAAASYRRASQLLSGWWTGGVQPLAEQPQATPPSEPPTSPASPASPEPSTSAGPEQKRQQKRRPSRRAKPDSQTPKPTRKSTRKSTARPPSA